eukprot:g5150.t1
MKGAPMTKGKLALLFIIVGATVFTTRTLFCSSDINGFLRKEQLSVNSPDNRDDEKVKFLTKQLNDYTSQNAKLKEAIQKEKMGAKVEAVYEETAEMQEIRAWHKKTVESFLKSLPGPGWTGDKAMAASAPTKKWLPVLDKRIASRKALDTAKVTEKARFMTKHFVGALQALESLGHRPMLRDGTLIAALRHHGWIDFGGSKYQTGYDMDPDALLASKSVAELEAMPSNKIGGIYTWKPYIKLKDYVKRHCENPTETNNFYANVLKIDINMQNGGEIWYGDTMVVDFSSTFRWKHADSSIYPMCYRHMRNSKPMLSFAMLVFDSEVFPIRHAPFYDLVVPIPARAEALVKRQWGKDVLSAVRIKTVGGVGSSSDSYLVEREWAPAVPLGPCQPDVTFREYDWYPAYADMARSLRPKGKLVSDYEQCEDFGQESKPLLSCSTEYQKLFNALDKIRAVYFPRSGTELGIVRQSELLAADGDLDIYVDIPSRTLSELLGKELSPAPRVTGGEVHWRARSGCAEVHLVYNDWVTNMLQRRSSTSADDLCRCKMNSIDLFCHRDGVMRMYKQYGPSWRVPLGVKQVDMPGWAKAHKSHAWVSKLREKLDSLKNPKTGVIEKVEGFDDPLILAQLNVLARSVSI